MKKLSMVFPGLCILFVLGGCAKPAQPASPAEAGSADDRSNQLYIEVSAGVKTEYVGSRGLRHERHGCRF